MLKDDVKHLLALDEHLEADVLEEVDILLVLDEVVDEVQVLDANEVIMVVPLVIVDEADEVDSIDTEVDEVDGHQDTDDVELMVDEIDDVVSRVQHYLQIVDDEVDDIVRLFLIVTELLE